MAGEQEERAPVGDVAPARACAPPPPRRRPRRAGSGRSCGTYSSAWRAKSNGDASRSSIADSRPSRARTNSKLPPAVSVAEVNTAVSTWPSSRSRKMSLMSTGEACKSTVRPRVSAQKTWRRSCFCAPSTSSARSSRIARARRLSAPASSPPSVELAAAGGAERRLRAPRARRRARAPTSRARPPRWRRRRRRARPLPREPAAQRIEQLLGAQIDVRVRRRQLVGRVALRDRARHVAHQRHQAQRRDADAEVVGGDVLELVRLVEDDRFVRRQQLHVRPFLAQRQVGEEEVVIDDHDVGRVRAPPRLRHEAALEVRAALAEPRLLRRRDVAPRGRVVGEHRAARRDRRRRSSCAQTRMASSVDSRLPSSESDACRATCSWKRRRHR